MMLNLEELEESLTRLDSVDAVRIVGDGDRVAEVHVLAAPAKAAKQVVRDVQSLAMARYGTNIDRRVISVVQLTPDKMQHSTRQRPVLVGIREDPDGSRVTVHVTLSWQSEEYVGSANGPSASSARLRLVGEATLHALEALYPSGPPFGLDAIGPCNVGMRTVVVAVVVSSVANSGEQVAVGAAISPAGDLAETAVRAVLDALNRRLPSLAG
ncbi:MAG TPA: hypothetical protein VGC11_09035 [Acidimicrobiia bacterium]|jgi:hypothetical protein